MSETKKGRGCLFYGAITMALVFLGVVGGIYFGARKAILTAVETYTTNAPAPVPKLTIPPAEQDRIARDLSRQAQEISQGAAQGRGPDELILGEQELNILIAQSPDLRAFSQQLYLRPEGDKLKAEMSLPLDQFPHWQTLSRKLSKNLQGRYLNGTATFDLALTNSALSLTLADFTANGKSLPAEFTKRASELNFIPAANTNAQAQPFLQRAESIRVHDGKVIVKLRR